MEVRHVSVGKEVFSYTGEQLTLTASHTQEMLRIVETSAALFPYEPTHAARVYGVPSLIARLDGVIHQDAFRCFEVQIGCSWIGYAGVANKAFRAIRDELAAESWPRFKLLMTPAEPPHDDELWIERITVSEALRNTEPLMIRRWLFNELDFKTRMALLRRSVKPVFFQNDKRYGEELGWWRRVMWDAGDEHLLPWDEPFVLKPPRGHGSADIMIWKPDDRDGRATRTQILRTLQKLDSMYLQPFYPPMRMTLGGKEYNAMLRPYFGYDTRTKRWVPMHGVWTARPAPNLRLHGASDAISGPLMFQNT